VISATFCFVANHHYYMSLHWLSLSLKHTRAVVYLRNTSSVLPDLGRHQQIGKIHLQISWGSTGEQTCTCSQVEVKKNLLVCPISKAGGGGVPALFSLGRRKATVYGWDEGLGCFLGLVRSYSSYLECCGGSLNPFKSSFFSTLFSCKY
jgi:hypothetical protein